MRQSKGSMDKWKLCKIEELEAHNKTREMYQNVKEVTGTDRRRAGNSFISSKEGRVLFDQQEIQDRWKEYIAELFADDRGENPQMDNTDGPVILKEEVRKAINSLRPGKAPGDDEISTEMLQGLDEIGIDKITDLCNKIYDSGYIPEVNIHFFTKETKSRELYRLSNH